MRNDFHLAEPLRQRQGTAHSIKHGAGCHRCNPVISGNSLSPTPKPPTPPDFWYFMAVGVVLGVTLTVMFSLPSFF